MTNKKIIKEKMTDIFNLPSVDVISHDETNDVIEAEIKDGNSIAPIKSDQEFDDDYHTARNNMRELLEKGKDALDNVLKLAKQDDHPRPYEVTGQILKHLADMNKDLLELHQRKKDIKGDNNETTSNGDNVTNAIFVGSTQELLEMMKKKKKNG